MASNSFYPSVLDILPVEKLPHSIRTLTSDIESYLKEVFYTDYIIEKSQYGDSIQKSLNLLEYYTQDENELYQ